MSTAGRMYKLEGHRDMVALGLGQGQVRDLPSVAPLYQRGGNYG
jgi:hypothetical protein